MGQGREGLMAMAAKKAHLCAVEDICFYRRWAVSSFCGGVNLVRGFLFVLFFHFFKQLAEKSSGCKGIGERRVALLNFYSKIIECFARVSSAFIY